MPEYLAPGVYVEEIPADVQPIAGVPTSTTAFLGATRSGPVDVPRLVRSFAEFEAHFGGLAGDMPLGYAVQQYFLNGGREAVIARVVPAAAPLTDADLSNPALEANKRGLWLLEHGGRFDLLCIPPLSPTTDVGKATWNNAIAYATRRNAVVIVDPPAAWTTAKSVSDAAVAFAGRPQLQRGALLSAAQGARSAARQQGRKLRALRGGCRHLCAHRRRARGLESPGRAGGDRARRAGIGRHPDGGPALHA
jgi:hypothetical protein